MYKESETFRSFMRISLPNKYRSLEVNCYNSYITKIWTSRGGEIKHPRNDPSTVGDVVFAAKFQTAACRWHCS